jgi:capsular exopolysaccharide synthesis family protein
MSENFELTRQVQAQLVGVHPSPISVNPIALPESNPVFHTHSRSEWTRALYVVWKYRRLSLGFAVSAVIIVLLLTILMKPVYEPYATLEISPPGAEAFAIQGMASLNGNSEYLETQSKNLQSEFLAIRVIRDLHLDQNPDFMGRSRLGTVLWRVGRLIPHSDSSRLNHSTANGPLPADISSLTKSETAALTIFQEGLTVKRDIQSRLIEVSFSSGDPQLAAVVLDDVITSFIDSTYESRHNAVVQASQWLGRQLEDVHRRMEGSNRTLAEYQKTTGIVEVDADKSTVSEQMAEQGRQFTQAQLEADQLKSYLDGVRTADPELLPQTGNDPVVQQLVAKLAQARADLAQATPIYGSEHPYVKRLQSQAQEFEKQLNRQRSAILAQLKTSYAAAQAKRDLVSSQMRDTSRKMTQLAQYNNLKREALANASLFNTLFAKIKEAEIEAEAKSGNVRIVSPPRVLDKPTRPNWVLNLGLAFALAIVGGVLIPFVVEKFDSRVYDMDQIRAKLSSANISVIPAANRNNGHLSRWPHLRLLNKPAAPVLFSAKGEESRESEGITALYTSILLAKPGHRSEVLLIASAMTGEGKTTIATNLAIAFAGHAKTCIVDADLRRSSVARSLQLEQNGGLAALLTGEAELDDVLAEVPNVPGLSLVCGGRTLHNPGRFILSDRMREIIETLRQRFDLVIVDSPPVLPHTDARMLSVLVDKVIFVSRFGSTTWEAIGRSLELLRSAHGAAPIAEVVLNAAENGYTYGYPAEG